MTTATPTPAVIATMERKAAALKRKLDKLYYPSFPLFYVGTEYIAAEHMIHVWVNATATDDTIDSGAFRADTRAWELYRAAQSVVDGIMDTMAQETLATTPSSSWHAVPGQ